MGPREKRLPWNIDETCTSVETRIPPTKKKTTEPVCVEDQRVENENQDDGGGPDKKMVETCGGGGTSAQPVTGTGDWVLRNSLSETFLMMFRSTSSISLLV